ncbi:hypothetical protein PLCT2_01080 [Planctomycetaceae bacterium]|nr:hypothetical protein PLCT2_01080 [Planctomycetaceae bacterium]
MTMSNRYRHTETPPPSPLQPVREQPHDAPRPQAAPQAAPSPAPRPRAVHVPQTVAELEEQLNMRKMVEAAVEKLYKRRGGERIDALLRLFDGGVALANLCREQDLKRAQGGDTLRAKGERPLISCSDSRLYGAKALTPWREREAMLADARERINTVLDSWLPRNAKEVQAALDVALGEATPTAREVIAAREREVSQAQSDVDAIAKESTALIHEVKDEKDRAILSEAWRTGEVNRVEEVISRQPQDWLVKWAILTERAQRYAGV